MRTKRQFSRNEYNDREKLKILKKWSALIHKTNINYFCNGHQLRKESLKGWINRGSKDYNNMNSPKLKLDLAIAYFEVEIKKANKNGVEPRCRSIRQQKCNYY